MPDRKDGHLRGGEHPNGRRAMRQLQGDLIKSGMDPRRAEKKARETAQQHARGQGAKRDPRRS